MPQARNRHAPAGAGTVSPSSDRPSYSAVHSSNAACWPSAMPQAPGHIRCSHQQLHGQSRFGYGLVRHPHEPASFAARGRTRYRRETPAGNEGEAHVPHWIQGKHPAGYSLTPQSPKPHSPKATWYTPAPSMAYSESSASWQFPRNVARTRLLFPGTWRGRKDLRVARDRRGRWDRRGCLERPVRQERLGLQEHRAIKARPVHRGHQDRRSRSTCSLESRPQPPLATRA